MDGIPDTLAINDGICKGTFERGGDVNFKPSWASDTHTIIFQDNDWLIIDADSNVVHTSSNWPKVEVVE